jgi:tRNA dimethylallyltransferase
MPELSESIRHCWFLAGPTAGGKTAVSLELAKLLDAEVVSMDSMAIYRGMDIGTAKPSPQEQQQVPHHLIDIVDPHQEFSVSEYVAHAGRVVDEILSRRRVPLFVGGTGLYLRSILRGVFEGPPANWQLRHELQQQAEAKGNDWLHSELRNVDAETAQRLHPNDVRRIIRAIEVFRVVGQPLSKLHRQTPRPNEERPARVVWIEPPRDWLHERINRRVDQMVKQGLLDETRKLLATDPPPGRTARQALGYREIISHLEGGVPLDEAIEQIKTGTRQFAKRQHTWFRNLEECSAVEIQGDETPNSLAQRILQCSSKRET